MPISYMKFCCDSYKHNVFNGLARLQQNQEFVDLTLAADNHLVKVHKNIIALASPYLKEMLQLTSCQDPVIFLNNVSLKVLCYLLDYIYQGEANIPQDSIEAFIQVAKNLQISGIESIDQIQLNSNSSNRNQQLNQEPVEQSRIQILPPDESFAAHNTILNEDPNFQVGYVDENIIVINEESENSNTKTESTANTIIDDQITSKSVEVEHVYGNMDVENAEPQNSTVETNQNTAPRIEIFTDLIIRPNASDPAQRVLNANIGTVPLLDLDKPIKLDKELSDALKKITQYSRSQRGCLQIIVNRYIYNSHHKSKKGRQHRWRCSNYRRYGCKAFVDSVDGVIIMRKGAHLHSFHDSAILLKHKRRLIFTTIEEAEESLNQPLISESAHSEGFEQTIQVHVVNKPNQ